MARATNSRVVVAMGGFDPSCGAGVAADVRTLEAFGVVPAAVATSITVQAGRRLVSHTPVAARLIVGQLEELLAELPVAVVKTGQLPTAAAVRAVALVLSKRDLPLVVDPVATASGGGRLASAAAVTEARRRLVPLATVVTVNLAEASAMSGLRVRDDATMVEAAERIAGLGAGAVVVKGGHLSSAPVDVLWEAGRVTRFRGRRIRPTAKRDTGMHGTGCAFASAVAAGLAHGSTIEAAVAAAREHVRELLRGAVPVAPAISLRAPRSR